MSAIEKAIQRERWKEARQLIQARLKVEPKAHWLLSRLATTYYEERNYRAALKLQQQAFALMPSCPLVLWGLASTHQMLADYSEAAAIYRKLIRRGVNRIAYGQCGEGIRWARGLVADCWYRLALLERSLGNRKASLDCLRWHIALRKMRAASIYKLSLIKKTVHNAKAEK